MIERIQVKETKWSLKKRTLFPKCQLPSTKHCSYSQSKHISRVRSIVTELFQLFLFSINPLSKFSLALHSNPGHNIYPESDPSWRHNFTTSSTFSPLLFAAPPPAPCACSVFRDLTLSLTFPWPLFKGWTFSPLTPVKSSFQLHLYEVTPISCLSKLGLPSVPFRPLFITLSITCVCWCECVCFYLCMLNSVNVTETYGIKFKGKGYLCIVHADDKKRWQLLCVVLNALVGML